MNPADKIPCVERLFGAELQALHGHLQTPIMEDEKLPAQSLVLATDFWARVEQLDVSAAVVINGSWGQDP